MQFKQAYFESDPNLENQIRESLREDLTDENISFERRILSRDRLIFDKQITKIYKHLKPTGGIVLISVGILLYEIRSKVEMNAWISLGLFVLFLLSLSYIIFLSLLLYTNSVKRNAIDVRLAKIIGFENRDKPMEYFNKLIQVNVDNLEKYYLQVKRHTGLSFIAALFVSTMGFLLLFFGVRNGFNSPEENLISYITAVSGVLVEFISGVFFYLYSQTVKQMKHFHGELINVQNILVSLRLVESIVEEKEKDNIISKMIEYLTKPDPDKSSEDVATT